MILILFFFFIFIYIWLRLEVDKKLYRLSKQEAKREALEKKNQELELEVTQLESLSYVEKRAETELKLVEPKEEEIIWLKP